MANQKTVVLAGGCCEVEEAGDRLPATSIFVKDHDKSRIRSLKRKINDLVRENDRLKRKLKIIWDMIAVLIGNKKIDANEFQKVVEEVERKLRTK